MSFKFGSLFSGIGGFDLGFERSGMECAWQCEIDKPANKVLAHHWPTAKMKITSASVILAAKP